MTSTFPINVIINPAGAVIGARRVNAELVGIGKTAGRLNRVLNNVFKFAGLTFGLQQIRRFSDSFIELQNRLRVAGFETSQLNSATQRLIDVSVRTRSPLDANARLLGRIGIAAKDLGASQRELFRFIELVGKGLAIQGATAQESRSALTQLAQAMGSGIVRAEEFNSVSEGAIVVLQGVAKSMGITVSQLRVLVTQGKVTSKQFFGALLKSGEEMDKLFKDVAPTLGQAFVVLETQLVAITGTLEQNFGLLSTVARGILLVANNLNILLPILINLGIAFATIKAVQFATTVLDFARATGTASGALNTLAATLPRTAKGVNLLSRALLFMARNPLFLIVGGLLTLVTLVSQFGDSIKLAGSESITLNAIFTGLGVVIKNVVTNVELLVPALVAIVTLFGLLQAAGIRTAIGGIVFAVGKAVIAFTAWAFAIAKVNLAFLVGPIGAVTVALLLGVAAIFAWRDELSAASDTAKKAFGAVDTAIEKGKEGFGELSSAVKEVIKDLGLLGLQAGATGNDLSDAGGAGTSAMDKAKDAADKAKKSVDSLGSVAKRFGTDFSSSSTRAAQGLGGLANVAASTSTSIQKSMSAASSAVRSVARDVNGVAGTGRGTRITPGGPGGGSFGASGALQRIASAIGGQAAVQSAGLTPLGGFRINFGIEGASNFEDAARASLERQAALALGTSALPASVAALVNQLATTTAEFQKAEGIAGLSESDRKRLLSEGAGLGGGLFGGGGVGGLFGGAGDPLGLALQQQQLQKQLDEVLRPPTENLNAASANLNDAASSLDDLAKSPIFLTSGNPFEAFRQKVFGFRRGGMFDVPGSGGPDSKIIPLALTPGERVNIQTKKQQRQADGREVNVQIRNEFNITTPDADSFRRSETQIIAKTVDIQDKVRERL